MLFWTKITAQRQLRQSRVPILKHLFLGIAIIDIRKTCKVVGHRVEVEIDNCVEKTIKKHMELRCSNELFSEKVGAFLVFLKTQSCLCRKVFHLSFVFDDFSSSSQDVYLFHNSNASRVEWILRSSNQGGPWGVCFVYVRKHLRGLFWRCNSQISLVYYRYVYMMTITLYVSWSKSCM